MGRIATESFDYAVQFFLNRRSEDKARSTQLENIVDRLEKEITSYVIKATSGKKLTSDLNRRSYIILQAVGDLERVGDHADNLIELTEYAQENNVQFSDKAVHALEQMIEEVKKILAMSLEALKTDDRELAIKVVDGDNIIDKMELDLRKAHIARLNEGTCNGSAGAVYLDILSNLERIGDHAVNIAGYVLGER